MVRSSNAACGSSVTGRSNHMWIPVMEGVFRNRVVSMPSSGASGAQRSKGTRRFGNPPILRSTHELHATSCTVLKDDSLHWRARANPDRTHLAPGIYAVQLAQRHVRDSHSYESARATASQPEHLEPVQGAIRSSSSLTALTSTWRQKRSMACGVCFFSRSQSSNGDLVKIFPPAPLAHQHLSMARAMVSLSAAPRQGMRRNDMVRCRGAGRGPRPRFDRRPPGSRKWNSPVEVNAIRDTQPRVKIEKVHAAAQEDVLAVIDQFGVIITRRKWERSCASAQKRASFKEST